MSDIIVKKQGTPSLLPETDEVSIYCNISGNLESVDALGTVRTYSTGVSTEDVQDIAGGMLEDSLSINLTYNDTLGKISGAVIPSGIDHSQLSNIGNNSHAQLDSHLASINNPHSVTKSQVGLANVDNTSDSAKPISSATQTALNLKENTITAATITDYWRGDKSFQPLNKTAVGLGNVDNTSDLNKPVSTAQAAAIAVPQSNLTAHISASDPHPQYETSSEVQTKVDAHANLTNNPHATTKSQVGLSNVDNTSDINKPISTATQSALNSKANASHTHVSSDVTDFSSAAIIAAKLNLTNNPPPIRNLTDMSSPGTSTEFARADHTHAFDVTGVVPGNYGDSLSVPSITVNSQGQVTSLSESLIPTATTSVAGLMSTSDKVKLNGLTSDVLLFTTSAISSGSNITLSAISELEISVTSGKRYKFKVVLAFSSASTNTGIGISMGGSATGVLRCNVEMPVSNSTGPSNKQFGPISTLNGVIVSTAVGSANVQYIAEIEGIFTATSNGTLRPQFRSENLLVNVTIHTDSCLEYKEY